MARTYMSASVPSWAIKHFANERGTVTKKSIIAAYADPTQDRKMLELREHPSGRMFTLEEAVNIHGQIGVQISLPHTTVMIETDPTMRIKVR